MPSAGILAVYSGPVSLVGVPRAAALGTPNQGTGRLPRYQECSTLLVSEVGIR